jgi:broad specificity phosphatase PhoE
MPADIVHLVRHGEVHNPKKVLYGRLEGFGLSDLGHRMASSAVQALAGHPVAAVYASPLQRAQESAAPWAEAFGLPIHTDERIIEPTNRFEGKRMDRRTLINPKHWHLMRDPSVPSWGEPFAEIAARMLIAMREAHERIDSGEIVMVSHQLPIWMVHRAVAGKRLAHDPRKRRCSLSSVTSFAWNDGVFTEIGYQDPAAELLEQSTDLGAV